MIHTLPDLHESGLDPRLWGSAAWKFMDALVLTYPSENPSPMIRETYRRFFEDLRHLLPCAECRQNHENFLRMRPLTDDDLADRSRLFVFYADLKNSVSSGSGRSLLVPNDSMVQTMLRNLWGDTDPTPPAEEIPIPIPIPTPRPTVRLDTVRARATASPTLTALPSTPIPRRTMPVARRGCGCGGYHRRR